MLRAKLSNQAGMAPGNDNLVKHAYAGIYNINGK
jgi:hypothetical protein